MSEIRNLLARLGSSMPIIQQHALANPSRASPSTSSTQFIEIDPFLDHSKKLALVERLMMQQEAEETELLKNYDLLMEKIDLVTREMEAEDIMKGANLYSLRLKKLDLQRQVCNYVSSMQETMEKLLIYQQSELQRAGFAMITVSDQLSDRCNQLWVLTPYVATLKAKMKG